MLDLILEETKEKMEKSIESFKHELSSVRTGRANPTMLDRVRVNYWGEMTPLNQTASISVAEGRQLVIKPYDKSTLKDIAAAINAANIGINPQVDADVIRLTFKAPTEDDRKLLVKKAKSLAEDAKIKIRRSRQELQDEFKKDPNALEDDKKYFQNELDVITKNLNKKIDEELVKREKEIMTI